MNVDRLTTGEKVLGVSGLILFLFSFFSLWAKFETNVAGVPGVGGTQRFNAWDAYGFHVKLAVLLGLVAFALVAARAADIKMDIPWGTVYLAVGGLSLLLMLIGILTGPAGGGGFEAFGASLEISRGLGLFIGTVLAAAMAAGAWMHYSGDTTTTTTTTTPPPSSPPPAV
ncbi:MAG: hypothetical protein QOK47_460 [Actinomycetota bacterium]|jgi:hypothetical protein|nr:hypothetical protein [Actinomycetota bacterium]